MLQFLNVMKWNVLIFYSVPFILSLIFFFFHFTRIMSFGMCLFVCLFDFGATVLQWAIASPFTRSLDHTWHTTVGRTPLDEWSAPRRDIYLTTPNTHNRQTAMSPGGIRTHNPSKRAAAELRLRPRGRWDRRDVSVAVIKYSSFTLYFTICVIIPLFSV